MADSQEITPAQTRINGPFGANAVPVPANPEPLNKLDAGAVLDGPPTKLTDFALRNAPGFAEARAARTEAFYRPESTLLEGIGAAMTQWDTYRIAERAMRPSFAGERTINQFEYLENTPRHLDEDEREYFLKVGVGEDSAKFALEQIDSTRLAKGVAGEHPAASFITAFADPIWLTVPPAINLGRVVDKLGKGANAIGRATSAIAGAGIAGGITAFGEGPISDTEVALSMLMNGAVAGALYKPGKGLVKADPDFPDAELDLSLQRATAGAKVQDSTVFGRRAREAEQEGDLAAAADWEAKAKQVQKEQADAMDPELPIELQPGTPNSERAAVASAVEAQADRVAKASGVGDSLQWNMRKQMSKYSPVGKRISDLLYDNNSDLSLTSIESQREAVLSAMLPHQHKFEDLLRSQMATDGAGIIQMANPGTSRAAFQVQHVIEKQVQREMFRREQAARLGSTSDVVGIPKHITEMADALDKMHAVALSELKRAGVHGADNLLERPGWLHRKWDSAAMENAVAKMESMGLPLEKAHAKIKELVSNSVRRGGTMSKEVSDQIGAALVDRALRKGYFEDSAFNAPIGEGLLKEMRDTLKSSGMSHTDIERALNVLRAESDDAGKAGFLHHRMDLDYDAAITVGDLQIGVMDLIDPNLTNIVDLYNRQVATSAAMARKGLKKPSDIENLRTELLHSIHDNKARAEAAELFDNTIAHFKGQPAGAKVNDNFRLMQAYGRSVTLAMSGVWQMTEYATIMARYGLVNTMKYAVKEFPGFRDLMKSTKEEAGSLKNILEDHSTQSLRLRPFITRFEDGYDMPAGSALQLSAQAWGNMIPTANALKYVHHHQARITSNLIIDRLYSAAKGNAKAREMLRTYGLESPVMDKVAKDIKTHGMSVDKWDDATWDAVRPALAKMMDESVLRERLGDMPAFAKFDQVGKFVFTYRSFVLTAHNKVMAGMAERNGVGSVGLLLLYQFPLSILAVQIQNLINNGKPLDNTELAMRAMGQMGGLGLLSEPLKWASGQSNSVGAPALIPVDRAIKTGQQALQGNGQNTAAAVLTMLPVVSATPYMKALSNQIKE